MADATNTVTVDGVEPSILTKLLDISENPYRVKVFNDDDGGERFLTKGGVPELLTPADLAILGAYGVEIVDLSLPDSAVVKLPASKEDEDVGQGKPAEGMLKVSSVSPPSGQTSPQA